MKYYDENTLIILKKDNTIEFSYKHNYNTYDG